MPTLSTEKTVKKIYSALVLLITLGTAQADVVYIADDYNLTLRNAANSYAPVVKALPTGTSVTVIGDSVRNGFLKVRLIDGTEGFIKAKYTKKEPPEQDVKDAASKNTVLLQNEIATLKEQLAKANEALTPGTSLEKSLANERDHLSRELSELKNTAAHAVQLKEEHDLLQERVVNGERDLEQLKLENQGLKDTTKQDWLLYGGALVIIGIFLGFILPKISWRRRSGWDTY
jgi:SH3 domain protein